MHPETRPSFYVHACKNLFYCHGCGRGGDLTEGRQMAVQTPAGSVADAQVFNEGGVAQSTSEQILNRFPMPVELQTVKGGGFFE